MGTPPVKKAALEELSRMLASDYRKDLSIPGPDLAELVERLRSYNIIRKKRGGPERRTMAVENRTGYRRQMAEYIKEQTGIELPVIPSIPAKFYNETADYLGI